MLNFGHIGRFAGIVAAQARLARSDWSPTVGLLMDRLVATGRAAFSACQLGGAVVPRITENGRQQSVPVGRGERCASSAPQIEQSAFVARSPHAQRERYRRLLR